jgi:hypothetical protein
MPRGKESELIPATSAEVFDLVHDYGRRMEWDTLLSAAYLDDGHTQACKGASECCDALITVDNTLQSLAEARLGERHD